jgi:hypothetical protein
MKVGFSQRVRLEWLEFAANELTKDQSIEEILHKLDDVLGQYLSVNSKSKNGNRAKALSQIKMIWLTPNKERINIHEDVLKSFKRSSVKNHLVHHWALSMACYPFFTKVARYTGALIQLQGEAKFSQIQRKLTEEYGDRQTVSRAAQRIVRCFHDWGVLKDTKFKGVYKMKKKNPMAINTEHQSFLVEGILYESPNGAKEFDDLYRDPALFPFQLDGNFSQLQNKNKRLVIKQNSFNTIMVGL